MSTHGIYIGETWRVGRNIAIGRPMYTRLFPATIMNLSLATLVVILLASLYSRLVCRPLEPVKALHTYS